MFKTPKIFQKLFPKVIWQIPNNEKIIYLTFDDGPIPNVTPWVLDLLKKHQAQATFFCIGDNVLKHQMVYHQILEDNHVIGNHTFNHLNGWNTKSQTYLENVEKCENEILNASKIFRPPYGKITPKQIKILKQNGYKIIMWNVLSYDFNANLDTEKALNKIIKHTCSGSIIVFHDSLKAFDNLKILLPQYLAYFSNRGFVFKGIER
jgi:peptidoglycan/xylan/chitin deacetylase (PgdA/CDA1 family)